LEEECLQSYPDGGKGEIIKGYFNVDRHQRLADPRLLSEKKDKGPDRIEKDQKHHRTHLPDSRQGRGMKSGQKERGRSLTNNTRISGAREIPTSSGPRTIRKEERGRFRTGEEVEVLGAKKKDQERGAVVTNRKGWESKKSESRRKANKHKWECGGNIP